MKAWTPAQMNALIGWKSGQQRTITNASSKKMYDAFVKKGMCKLESETDKEKTYVRI